MTLKLPIGTEKERKYGAFLASLWRKVKVLVDSDQIMSKLVLMSEMLLISLTRWTLDGMNRTEEKNDSVSISIIWFSSLTKCTHGLSCHEFTTRGGESLLNL